ncbi:MAG: segregation/condensation protein A [Candidatus Syntrophonatronum acetioxidans]|uniref:Segregation and condensation protein A n=1 Tax=Candidatus Syntrophonatronum acetioxidans TaxID=1795816 RepID=A0A424YFJ9_9FIRM|nr:MAG: segregation/condensation protein A [Candidatus Syntrophonatronum acetioxidans]
MDYKVKTDVFEGPFDLLFHLVKKAEIDIYQVPISQIAYQYLEYVKEIQEFNPEIAGDFLVMASTLLKLKSQRLLPSLSLQGEEEAEEEGLLYSSEEELFERMLEYRQYKSTAEILKKMEEEEKKYFPRPVTVEVEEEKVAENHLKEYIGKVTLKDLTASMEKVMKNLQEEEHEVILPQEISLTQKMEEIVSFLDKWDEAELEELLESQRTRSSLIVTFFALLILVKLNKISVWQKYGFGPILVRNNNVKDGPCLHTERWGTIG